MSRYINLFTPISTNLILNIGPFLKRNTQSKNNQCLYYSIGIPENEMPNSISQLSLETISYLLEKLGILVVCLISNGIRTHAIEIYIPQVINKAYINLLESDIYDINHEIESIGHYSALTKKNNTPISVINFFEGLVSNRLITQDDLNNLKIDESIYFNDICQEELALNDFQYALELQTNETNQNELQTDETNQYEFQEYDGINQNEFQQYDDGINQDNFQIFNEIYQYESHLSNEISDYQYALELYQSDKDLLIENDRIYAQSCQNDDDEIIASLLQKENNEIQNSYI